MTNTAEWKKDRILNIHIARKVYARIQAKLAAGGQVLVTTCLRNIQIQKKHAEMVRLNGHKVQIQSGRSWNTIVENGIVLVGIRYAK